MRGWDSRYCALAPRRSAPWPPPPLSARQQSTSPRSATHTRLYLRTIDGMPAYASTRTLLYGIRTFVRNSWRRVLRSAIRAYTVRVMTSATGNADMTQNDYMQRMLAYIEAGDAEALYQLSDELCAIAFRFGGCTTEQGRAWQAIMQAASDAAQEIEA